MPIVFVFTKDYNIGVEQMIALLKARAIPVGLVLSRFSFAEMAYLRYQTMHGGASRGKARRLLEADEERIVRRIREMLPLLVGFSVTTDSYQWSLSVASRVKAAVPGCFVVMGGAHPTFSPERTILQPWVDAVCIGESDLTIADLYDSWAGRLPHRDVKGIWFKEKGEIVKNAPAPLVQDLDGLPFKDSAPFLGQNPASRQAYVALSARGCPFNCSYCNSASYKKLFPGNHVRKRSPGSMLEELASAKKATGCGRIMFADDVFTLDYEWLKGFLPSYKKTIGLPYYCLLHPDMASEKTIELLKDTGCDTIKCGIQTVNPALCRRIFHRNLDLDKTRKVIRRVREAGIGLKLDFIIGAPEETEQDLKDLIAFIVEAKADDIFLYFLKYYPGTEILRFALTHGHITQADSEDALEGREAAYNLIPERFRGEKRSLYEKYSGLIREAAGSKFSLSQFEYLLEDGP